MLKAFYQLSLRKMGAIMSRRNLRSSRRLGLESLENRLLLAGNVAVSVSTAGDLVVTGDGQANELKIIQSLVQGQPVPGKYFITGQNGTTITGTVNGYIENVNRDMLITLNGGADKLYMGDGVSLDRFLVPRDLTISSGDGNDSVQINRISVRDDVTINTGIGDDKVGFVGAVGYIANVDNNANDLQINTSSGADSVTVLGGYVRRDFLVNTGSGADEVWMQNLGVGDDLEIYTGTEDDKVTLTVNINIVDDLTVDTDAGRDDVTIDKLAVDEFFTRLGDGHDVMKLTNATGRRATIDGQVGNDQLTTTNSLSFSESIEVISI